MKYANTVCISRMGFGRIVVLDTNSIQATFGCSGKISFVYVINPLHIHVVLFESSQSSENTIIHLYAGLCLFSILLPNLSDPISYSRLRYDPLLFL